ncbi:MAG: two pore domain potassium channel family protein [Zoogloeaceae bacterium]|nr:two pore domain potassium channel family protein [Zoogloeaceae bacterium]
MLTVVPVCLLMLALTTLIHYEALSWIARRLPALPFPSRFKVVVVLGGAFVAHVVEIALYALAFQLLVRLGAGALAGEPTLAFDSALYFSGETFTSLGYGDLVPSGALRLLASTETLNGLLLIGWSASYTYIAMERFWSRPG